MLPVREEILNGVDESAPARRRPLVAAKLGEEPQAVVGVLRLGPIVVSTEVPQHSHHAACERRFVARVTDEGRELPLHIDGVPSHP